MRLIASLTCVAAAWMAWSRPTAINSYFFMEWGVSSAQARWIDSGAVVCLSVSALVLIRTHSRLACAFACAWLFVSALTHANNGGEAHAQLAPFAQAARYGTPLALLCVYSGHSSHAFWWLRVCAALTFIAHGYEASAHAPGFLDLIILSARNLLGLHVTESAARSALTVIGWIDFVLAALVLVRRWRPVAAYMAFWGLVTLSSRITAFGFERWPDALLRISNAGVPFCLWLRWRPTAAFLARSTPS